MPALSVVVPTYRRPALLRRCLASLCAQDVPQGTFDVAVVDDASGDATPDVLREFEGRLPLSWRSLPQNRGPAAARNRAVDQVAGELLLFLDDDVVAPPSLVAEHLRRHEQLDRPSSGVLGRVAWHPSLRVTHFMRWLDRSGLQFGFDTWLRPGPVEPPYAAFYTANLSLWRSAFVAAGGFDERFPYPAYEDMELAWRLAGRGFRLHYDPEALAWHARPIDLRGFCGRMAKVAESAAVLAAVQPAFPVTAPELAGARRRRRRRLLLAGIAPLARLARRHDVVHRHYRAEIAASWEEGRRRGDARLRAIRAAAG